VVVVEVAAVQEDGNQGETFVVEVEEMAVGQEQETGGEEAVVASEQGSKAFRRWLVQNALARCADRLASRSQSVAILLVVRFVVLLGQV